MTIDLDKLEALRAKAERGFGMELHEAYKNELFVAAPALFAELRRLRARVGWLDHLDTEEGVKAHCSEAIRVENEALRKIVADCIEQGTDGHAHPACSLEFLSYAPREVAAVKRQRDEARKEYEKLLRRTEKREETERIVGAGSLPAHLERAEEQEITRLRQIEEAARDLLAGHAKLGLHSEAWTGLVNALAAKGEA